MKKTKKVKELILKLHAFELNSETRRMICVDCQGVMNQCPVSCPGLSGENRHALARQFVGSLGEFLNA